jgi:hypothetical protein
MNHSHVKRRAALRDGVSGMVNDLMIGKYLSS